MKWVRWSTRRRRANVAINDRLSIDCPHVKLMEFSVGHWVLRRLPPPPSPPSPPFSPLLASCCLAGTKQQPSLLFHSLNIRECNFSLYPLCIVSLYLPPLRRLSAHTIASSLFPRNKKGLAVVTACQFEVSEPLLEYEMRLWSLKFILFSKVDF